MKILRTHIYECANRNLDRILLIGKSRAAKGTEVDWAGGGNRPLWPAN